MDARIHFIVDDITTLAVDAIVNAANRSLLGGGGVDGAIHRAAGAELLAECRTLGGCRTGEAKITKGYALPARYVIHTVGPIYHGTDEDADLLAACYVNCLELAYDKKLESIAFPSISTGAYRYPIAKAARIALNTVEAWLAAHPDAPIEVTFVCYDDAAIAAYRTLINTKENKV